MLARSQHGLDVSHGVHAYGVHAAHGLQYAAKRTRQDEEAKHREGAFNRFWGCAGGRKACFMPDDESLISHFVQDMHQRNANSLDSVHAADY
jgi:hypothetical protein